MEDQAETTAVMEMPRTVRIAVNIYWAVAALSVPMLLLFFVYVLPGIDAALQKRHPDGGDFTMLAAIMAISFIIGMALYVLIIWKLSSGKNWARILVLLFLLMGIHSSYNGIVHPAVPVPLIWLMPGVIMNLLQGVAVFLLFLPASGAWFRKRVDS